MELCYVFQLIVTIFNLVFKTFDARPMKNETLFIDTMFPSKKMTDDLESGINNEYDDYEEPFEALIKSKSDNSLDTFLIPPDLGVSKQTLKLQVGAKPPAPEYMMELYEKFSKNKLNHPSSSIVRSFTNINIKDTHILNSKVPVRSGMTTRVHRMAFNITSISPDETVDLAELRLFTLVEKDRNTYLGIDRKVTCLEVLFNKNEPFKVIESKHIYGRHSGWETFDVTSAVRHWVTDLNSILVLEIRIESVLHELTNGEMDINVDSQDKNEPILVVFSSDKKVNGLHRTERHELITREMDTVNVIQFENSNSPQSKNDKTESINSINDHSTDLGNYHVLNRKKRSRKRHMPCHRRPMYISFSDINWDDWIIAPQGYQAYECVGRCYFPLNDHLSPTKYAIMRGLLHSAYPSDYSRPCCVPTKLDPISILYIDEQGVPTYKYKYDGMVVAECGCR